MKYEVTPQGVCPARLEFELDGNVVHNVQFLGGCNGNLQAVSRLVEGLTVDQIKSKLLGIHCGFKDTSCSDQLARAIVAASRTGTAEIERNISHGITSDQTVYQKSR